MRTFLRWIFLATFLGSLIAVASAQVPPPPLFWDANPELDVELYNLYEASAPCTITDPAVADCPGFVKSGPTIPQAADPITTQPPGSLIMGVPIYYRVTAVNFSGLESPLSNELRVIVLNTLPPGAPGDLRDQAAGSVTIIGDGNSITVVYNFTSSGPGSPRGQPRP